MGKYVRLTFAAAFCAVSLYAGNRINPDAVELRPLPVPVEFKSDMDRPVAFDETADVTVMCPDTSAVEWLASHFAEWYGKSTPKVAKGYVSLALRDGDEAYSVKADAAGVKIAARSLAGVRWAAYTLRQLAIAGRGQFRTGAHILPTIELRDSPHLPFRAVHLCWFPEVRPQQMERVIRLAALLKFNYAIIDPWGMYGSEKHPWWHWPKPTMTKERIRRLVAVGRDLGITLIPQINAYGHATASRTGTLKHSVIDLHPEYASLFEPGGWNWCVSNPETQRVLRELIAEMHDDFGRPPFFHLGCDEAQPPSCPDCRRIPNGELVCRHIAGLAEYLRRRGARAMIWHDMLLQRGDARWKGFIACGTKETAKMADTLPKDIIICDWQYQYGKTAQVCREWPTIAYFREKGFPVCACPFTNYNSMRPMADFISERGGFGFIATTWNCLFGVHWVKLYTAASSAAWGTPSGSLGPHGDTPQFNTRFAIALRLIGHDMKVDEYMDTGLLNHQMQPAFW